jgi:hypothetical protein
MRRVFLAVFLAALIAGPAAALMIKLDTPTLARHSDDVLVGRVVALEYQWDEAGQYIYTHVTVAVSESVKSVVTQKEVVLKVPGGEADGLVLMVSDTPEFQIGQEVVVFVAATEDGTFEVVGSFQGKYTLEGDTLAENGLTLDGFLGEVRASLAAR